MANCKHGKEAACSMDCLAYSLEIESRHAPEPKYVHKTQREGGVDDLERDAAVSWVLVLNTHLGFSQQTFFLAVNYLDRFLSAMRVKNEHLQLLMASCFLLASKVQEETDQQPTLRELVRAGKHTFSASDLLRMERIVCCKLNWEFSSVTPLNFLVHYMEVAATMNLLPVKKHMEIYQTAASFLEQVCLYDFLRYPPSLQALCSLLFAVRARLSRAQAEKAMRKVLNQLQSALSCNQESQSFRLCMADTQFVIAEARVRPVVVQF